jgi:hypothetical protein
MEALHTTCPTYPTPHKLHSWPGMGDSFDDEDVDDFECEDDDLPGLRTLHSAAITFRVHETPYLDS